MNPFNTCAWILSKSVVILLTLWLSACHMGSKITGKKHLIGKEYIPLHTTPYACPSCQQALGKILPAEYEKNRAALTAEKAELGDFTPLSGETK